MTFVVFVVFVAPCRRRRAVVPAMVVVVVFIVITGITVVAHRV